jgi:hypothetical protein
MTRSADSELAANLCRSSGTTGEVRTIRGLGCSGSRIWPLIPLSAEAGTPQTAPARTFHAYMHPAGSHFPRGTDHSKPIGRPVVERFSPTRL